MAECICSPLDGPAWECPHHGPCQGCHAVTGELMVCDGTCDGLTAENEEAMRAAYAAKAVNAGTEGA